MDAIAANEQSLHNLKETDIKIDYYTLLTKSDKVLHQYTFEPVQDRQI